MDDVRPAPRVSLAVTVVAGAVFVVLAAVLVPWHWLPGGHVHAVPASSVFTAEQIDRGEHVAWLFRLPSWANLGHFAKNILDRERRFREHAFAHLAVRGRAGQQRALLHAHTFDGQLLWLAHRRAGCLLEQEHQEAKHQDDGGDLGDHIVTLRRRKGNLLSLLGLGDGVAER